MEIQRDDARAMFAPVDAKGTRTWGEQDTMWLLAIAAGVSVAFATAALFAQNPGLTMAYSLITLLVCIVSVRFYATRRAE